MIALFAAAPALPLHSAGKYVAGAYIVFVALILVYVAIMARRLVRNERELAELRRELLDRPSAAAEHAVDPEHAVEPESEREAVG
jgi:hypothetical protein